MSNYNLKNFMISGLKKNDTLTFKGIDTFKDENGVPIPLKFKQISRTEVEDIRKKFVHKTPAVDKEGNYIIRNGRIINDIDVDYDSFTDELIVEIMVQPDLRDKEFLDFYGVYAGTELLHILFKGDDYRYIDGCAAQAADMAPIKEENLIKELKN